jgi:O-antigen ligase
MARDRPVWGFGSGSFAERFRARERVRTVRAAAVSHTTPLTVAAEQGVIGLVFYAALLWFALLVLFDGLRRAVRHATPSIPAVAGVAVAAGFCALVLHTLVYASFLEDPLTWALLGIACGLGPAWRSAPAPAAAEPAPGGQPGPAPVPRPAVGLG